MNFQVVRSRAVLVLAFLLVACAANYGDRRTDDSRCSAYIDEQRLQAELGAAADCCTDLRGIKGAAATFDGEALYGLLKTSPAFSFAAGKSRFAAFQLDSSTPRKFLVVRPVPSGMTTLATSCSDHKFSALIGNGSARYRAIEPIVIFLDSSGSMLASGVTQVDAFRVPIPAGATVAVVHTAPGRYGTDTCLAVAMSPIERGITAQTPCGSGRVSTMVTATGFFSVSYAD
jgi:hypothetical protein